MRTIILLFFIGLSLEIAAQPALKAIEDNDLKLNERYDVMKSNSQTFNNYKVIRENILDGFWKITTDSVNKQKNLILAANQEIALLKTDIDSLKRAIQNQQASISEIEFDSTHINVLGVSFNKNVFIVLVAAIIGGLIFILSGIFTRMKILGSLVKEKTLIADSISNELEEIKKKSLEKQAKLSRELQNERNKLMELRRT
jgi:SMC interacting uncharacterized protein involved in chromosome segregation